MTDRPVRIATRVLPTGEVIVVVEPIIAAARPQLIISEDRNRVTYKHQLDERRP